MDSTLAFRGRDELTDLVRWARDDSGAREQHWVEWKGAVDLADRAWQAKVAKFVLGTANRPKRIWELAAEGRAYMLLGVNAGQLHPAPLPDSAVFEKGVNKYLGADRPRWMAMQLEVDGTQVAVITVEPPEPGLRPYVARGSYTPIIEDGRIYIRRDSETIQASSAEFDEMIREREAHARGAGPAWALRLEVEESSLIMVDLSETLVQEWLDAERNDLVGALLPRDNPLNAFLGKGLGEKRTREEFHQEVDAYLEAARKSLRAEVLWRLHDLGGSEIRLAAYNDGDDILLDLEVELVLPPETDAAGSRDDISNDERLPDRPRPYGSSPFMTNVLGSIRVTPYIRSGIFLQSSDDGMTATLPSVEVRPRNKTGLLPVTILLPATVDRTELEIRWRATARDRRGVAEGSVVVPVMAKIAFTQLLTRPDKDEVN